MTRNIYYDTEFLEGTQKKRFLGIPYGNTKNTIDLISIGMADDEGNKYYAISKDFNLREAWNRYDLVKDGFRDCGLTPNYKKVYWIRENVLKPIWEELKKKEYGGSITRCFTYDNFKWLINEYGKSNKQIAEEVKEFVYGFAVTDYPQENTNKIIPKDINLYAYYGSYDHVVLAWLYGKMIDLPKGFPMYTNDLKQELDRVSDYKLKLGGILRKLKYHPAFPKNENAHSSIDDAIWNKELHEFLKQL